MRAIRYFYGTTRSVRKAFEAGNDIIVFRFNKEKQIQSINEINNLVNKGKIKEARINRSVKRIINIKEKYNISDEDEIEKIDLDEINEQIKLIKQKCEL